MHPPEDEPKLERSHLGLKLLAIFAIIGVIGLGACGYTMNATDPGNAAEIGIVLIGISLAGLVCTGIGMLIAVLTEPKQ